MARRLVLGCGAIGHAVVVGLASRTGDLSVIDPDPDRVEQLRTEGVPAELGDPADPAVFPADARADVVFVAGDDPGANRAAAEAAREALPAVPLVVYTGLDPTPAERDAIDAVADHVVDRGASVAGQIAGAVETDRGRRHRELVATLRGVSGRLGVFTHDNPDPDAIGAAIALRDLARAVGTESEACYFGDITHQENRALVNLLDLDLRSFDADAFDPEEFGGIALVDHSRPGVNDQLPEDLPVTVVIDHHPPRGPVGGTFVDLREDAGATSTLLAGYFRTLGAEIDPVVATALLYGIRIDTREFGRGIAEADFEAAAYLVESADLDALGRIENPSVSRETLAVLARAVENRDVRGAVLATSAGWTTDRDALAQAADTLLGMEGISTVVVLGLFEESEMVVASARARGEVLDIGEVLREAYGPIGSAGGHTDMAGAQIPLGILGSIEDGSGSLESVIGDVLIDRFYEVVAESDGPATGAAGDRGT